MALRLTFAQPLETPQGFQITTLYARLRKVEYFRDHPVSDVGRGLASYGVDYFLSAELAARPEAEGLVLPNLPRTVVDSGDLVSVPSPRPGMPDGEAYAGLAPSVFNQAGGYTRGYARIAQVLQGHYPDLVLEKV